MKSIIDLLTTKTLETYYHWFFNVGSITRYTNDEFYRNFGETKMTSEQFINGVW